MNRRRLVQLLAVVALAVSIGATAPAAAQYVSNYIARTFTSTAPSGVNGFACRANGCRVDLGAGAFDYLASDGSQILAGGSLSVGSTMTASTVNATLRVAMTAAALPTCVAGQEGSLYRLTGTGGTGTLSQTRLCVCVSDGAASPVYSWRNIVSGTAGNSTTCNP